MGVIRGSSYATLGPENQQGTRALGNTSRCTVAVKQKHSSPADNIYVKGLCRFECQGPGRTPKAEEFTKTRYSLQTIDQNIITTVALYKRATTKLYATPTSSTNIVFYSTSDKAPLRVLKQH